MERFDWYFYKTMITNYKVGEEILGKRTFTHEGETWCNVYTVLEVTESSRFGNPCQRLKVSIKTSLGKVINEEAMRWADQLV